MCDPRLRSGGEAVALAELVHATAAVDDLLLARIERVAAGTDLDLQVLAERRARLEGVAAGAGDRYQRVLRMNVSLHDRSRRASRGRDVS